MSVTLRKDILKIKDPALGTYREAAIFSSDLPGTAAEIIADTQAALTTQESRAAGIVADTQDDIDTIAAAVASMANLGTDTTLTVSGAAADSATVGAKLEDYNLAVRLNSEMLNFPEEVELYYKDAGSGSVKRSDGTIISSSSFHYTDYIDVSKYYKISYKRTAYTSSNPNWGIVFYDSDKNYLYGKLAIASQPAHGYVEDYIFIGQNAKYCRATIYADTSTYGNFEISGSTRASQMIDDGNNIWAYGDVYVNMSSGAQHYYLDRFLPAGTYTIELDVIGTSPTAPRIYFLSSTNAVIQSNDSVGTFLTRVNNHFRKTFELTGTAKSIGFLASQTVSESNGNTAYFYNIKLVPGSIIDSSSINKSIHDVELSDNAYGAKVIDYSNKFIRGGYIDLNNSPTSISNITSTNDYSYVVIPCKSGDRFVSVSYGQITPRAWGFIDSDGKILAHAIIGSSIHSGTWLTPTQLKAPPNSAYFIVNHYHYSQLGYSPKAFKLSGNAIIDQIAYSKHILPMRIDEDWKRKVVSVYEQYIAIKDGNLLRRSDDCGMTWNDGVDVSAVGRIVSYHMYATGTLAFFTDQKAYYIEDWNSYNEASCYESDGSAYTPETNQNFYTFCDVPQRKFIENQDMYVFGNYVTDATNNGRPVLWYSIDNGHTYKIAYEFNLSNTYSIRHVHTVVYYSPEDTFICCTGDSNATQCWVLKCDYDTEHDTWSITSYNQSSSRSYKWAYLSVWGDELYFSYDNTPGEIRKCKYSNIADTTKHESVLSGTTTDAIGCIFGKRGDMIVTCSRSRSTGGASIVFPLGQNIDCRKIYYSSNRKDFAEIFIDPQVVDTWSVTSGILPLTADGHLFCGIHGDLSDGWDKLPSLCLDDCVRLAGYNDAFKPL